MPTSDICDVCGLPVLEEVGEESVNLGRAVYHDRCVIELTEADEVKDVVES